MINNEKLIKYERIMEDGEKKIFIDKPIKGEPHICIPVSELDHFEIHDEEVSIAALSKNTMTTVNAVRAKVDYYANYVEADDSIYLEAVMVIDEQSMISDSIKDTIRRHNDGESSSLRASVIMSEDKFFDAIAKTIQDSNANKIHKDSYMQEKMGNLLASLNKTLLEEATCLLMSDIYLPIYAEFRDSTGAQIGNAFGIMLDKTNKHSSSMTLKNTTFINSSITEAKINDVRFFLFDHEITLTVTQHALTRFNNDYQVNKVGSTKLLFNGSSSSKVINVNGITIERNKQHKLETVYEFKENYAMYKKNREMLVERGYDPSEIDSAIYDKLKIKNFIKKILINVNDYFMA